MIKVTYKEIRAGMFTPAFDRLCNNPNLQEKVSYNVSRIAAKMHPKLEKAQNEFLILLLFVHSQQAIAYDRQLI